MARRKTFEDITDYWQFKGYRLLKDAIEKARALAVTDKEQGIVGLMMERLKMVMSDELVKSGKTAGEIADIVLQIGRPDRYASGLIAGRFQILESVISGSYYLVDHALDDLMLRVSGPASDIRRFSSIQEAEALIDQFTSGHVHDTAASTRGMSLHGTLNKEGQMAKNPKAVLEARKAAAEADAALDRKKSAVPAKKAAAPAKKVAAEPAAEGRKMPEARAGAPTVANFTREMIMVGKKTEQQIVDAVRAEFPDKSIAKNVAAHYHAQLVKGGKSPPPFKEG